MPVPVADTHDVAGGRGRREVPARVLPSSGSFFDGLGAPKPEEAGGTPSAGAGASAGAAGGRGAAVRGNGSGAVREAAGADAGEDVYMEPFCGQEETAPGLEVKALNFAYPPPAGVRLSAEAEAARGEPNLLENFSMTLPRGSCCLLLGANGAGKTTLLRILAGQHMVPREAVLVLGQSPFFNTTMISHNRLSYIGGSWRRDVAFAGYDVPMSADIRAGDMIERVHGVKASRRELLMKVLDVNPEWRLHRVSEGQRRRVQLCMGLLHEYEVLFLDEITVDLDVLVRADLVAFLRRECAERRCTVIYATHIFDGLEGWPTHVAYLARGNLQEFGTVAEFPELATGGPEKGGELVKLVEKWLRREQAIVAELRQKQKEEDRVSGKKEFKREFQYALNNGWGSGRLNSTLKLSSNAVWRC